MKPLRSWDEFWKERPKLEADLRKFSIFRRNLQMSEIHSVLEAGCGCAADSFCFVDIGCEFFGVDLSLEAIRVARKNYLRFKHNSNFIVGDINHLPFKNNFFNLVWNAGVLEHFKDLRNPLLEMIRVVRPKGTVAVFIPGKFSLWTIFREIMFLAVKLNLCSGWPYGWERSFTIKELESIFAKLNLVDIRCERLSMPYKLKGWPSDLFPLPLRALLRKVLSTLTHSMRRTDFPPLNTITGYEIFIQGSKAD